MDGIPIQGEEQRLRSVAKRKHDEWLRDGENVKKKRTYALALLEWGRETHKQDAIDQAQLLLGACGEVAKPGAFMCPRCRAQLEWFDGWREYGDQLVEAQELGCGKCGYIDGEWR